MFNNKRTKKEPMMLVETISEPWRRVALDVVGPFERTNKGSALLALRLHTIPWASLAQLLVL
jgi:hypothetical protein